MLKKLVSIILVFSFCLCSFAALTVSAENTSIAAQNEAVTSTELENNGISIEGTDSFGNMISEAIDQETVEQYENNGNNIISVEIDATTAIVEFETTTNSLIIVGIYNESGTEMYTYGKANVTCDDTVTQILLDPNNMPPYYLVKAFLVDKKTNLPLCTCFESSIYTKEMQDFLSKTTEDFDESLVLNLDDDITNNFAIYNQDTIIIESLDNSINTVTELNDEEKKYVIENADESITNLREGDVFSYEYNEDNLLIVKVKSIVIKGTTATIYGDEIELEDVFDYVRIEGGSDATQAEVDSTTSDEAVEYIGIVDDSTSSNNHDLAPTGAGDSNIASTGVDISGKMENKLSFNVNTKDSESPVKLDGGLDFGISLNIKIYITLRKQYIELKIDYELKIAIKAKITLIDEHVNDVLQKLSLGGVSFHPVAAIKIHLQPAFVYQINATIELNATISGSIGARLSLQEGFKNLTTAPKAKYEMKVEGKIFVGIEIEAKATATGKLVEAKITATVGAEIKGTISTDSEKPDSVIHQCKNCIKGEVNAVIKLSYEVKFLNAKFLRMKGDIAEIKIKVLDFYYSFDFNEFDFTICPHKQYKFSFTILDEYNNILDDAVLTCDYETNEGKNIHVEEITNKQGKASLTLPPGQYEVKISCVGHNDNAIKINVIDESEQRTVKLSYKTTYTPANSAVAQNYGKIIASGKCGVDVDYAITENALLVISGHGGMYDYYYDNPCPWQYYYLEKAIIENGVTSIGTQAFAYTSINEIKLPNTLKVIKCEAFRNSQIKRLTIPSSVVSIEDDVFWECYYLMQINVESDNANYASLDGVLFNNNLSTLILYPNNKTNSYYSVPQSVKAISDNAFDGCSFLERIVLPEGLFTLGICSFGSCPILRSITIPSSVSNIGFGAFRDCNSLSKINVNPNNQYYRSLDGVLFSRDKKVLISYPAGKSNETYTVPNGVQAIEKYAFLGCSNISSILLPDTLLDLGFQSFFSCGIITSTIPNSITTIKRNAFSGCFELTSVYIPRSVKRIEAFAFEYCYDLKEVYYEGNGEEWGNIIIDQQGNDKLLSAKLHNYSNNPPKNSNKRSDLTSTGITLDSNVYSREHLIPTSESIIFVMSGENEVFDWDDCEIAYIDQKEVNDNGVVEYYLCNEYPPDEYYTCIIGYCDHSSKSWYKSMDATQSCEGLEVCICDYCDEIVETKPIIFDINSILGDADGDGTVTILDATVIQRYLAAYSVKNPDTVIKCGDIAGDGLDILDATLIQRYLADFTVQYEIGKPIN